MFRGSAQSRPDDGFAQTLPGMSDTAMETLRNKCDRLARKHGPKFLIITGNDVYLICRRSNGKWWFKHTDQSAVEDFPESKTVHWDTYIGRA